LRCLVLALSLIAPMAQAADRALILANGDYRAAAEVAGAAAAMQAAPAMRAEGFVTMAVADQTAAGLRARLADFLAQIDPGDRVAILAVGHFVQARGETWLLGTEAAAPDLATAGGAGVSVATLLAVAAEVPGGALVMLGAAPGRLDIGRGLAAGIGPLAVPQGVTVVQGEPARLAEFAARQATRRGLSVPQMLAAAPGLTGEGFLAPQPFRAAAVAAPAPVPPPPRGPTDAERAEEDRQVALARAAGTVAGWQTYLARWPAGRYVAEARAEIARLNADPAARARAAEEALGLTRDQRRAVQRQLSLLGFDPRGVDGVFGPGSRAAITAWQRANAEPPSGFLTRDQVVRLTAQAERRAAELEAEAAARRAEQERQDRLWWDETGARNDEAGLRAYLRRYPDGLFAELAQARLDRIEADRRAEAAAADRSAWDAARAADTVRAYRDYLAAYPGGAFNAEANARIEALQRPKLTEAERAQAEAAEADLNLGGVAMSLIEQRLDALGFEPGPADGVFDARTRRAIRRFQASRGMAETGYLDQAAMVGLLAGGVLRLGE
jgi:peptidoglycan hydrolase-like protein with peptidoglycan-binding domain